MVDAAVITEKEANEEWKAYLHLRTAERRDQR